VSVLVTAKNIRNPSPTLPVPPTAVFTSAILGF
jgi:hypothetical protein